MCVCMHVCCGGALNGLRTQADSHSLNPCPKGCSLFFFFMHVCVYNVYVTVCCTGGAA